MRRESSSPHHGEEAFDTAAGPSTTTTTKPPTFQYMFDNADDDDSETDDAVEAEATHKQAYRIQMLKSGQFTLAEPDIVHMEGFTDEVDNGDATSNARQQMLSEIGLSAHRDHGEFETPDTTAHGPDTTERSGGKASLSAIAGAMTIVPAGTALAVYCKPDWLSWPKPSKQVWK